MLHGPHIIGMLVTDVRNPFQAEVLLGVEQGAGAASVLLANGGRDPETMRARLRDFDALDVAGVVISSSWLPPDDITEAGRGRPVVLVGSSVVAVPGTDTVRGDVDMGILQTVEHLVALGHRRIGFVAESVHSSSRRRHASYLEQMARFMQEENTLSVHIEDLLADAQRLRSLVRDRGFTAFIGANDMTAVALLKLASNSGLRVPEDVAVAGYDDTSMAQVTTPELTSVSQPWQAMGARAIELIGERALGRKNDRDEVVTPRLMVRGSTLAGA